MRHPTLSAARIHLARSLPIVALLGHGLPVPLVPEQMHIPTVGYDVVHDGGRYCPQLTFLALLTGTERALTEEHRSRNAPLDTVPALSGCAPFSVK